MTRLEYRILIASSMSAVFLAACLLILSLFGRSTETNLASQKKELESLQAEIKRGAISEKVLQSIKEDLEPLVNSKPLLNSLLSRYGINLKNPITPPAP
ncbi:MAG: hypothetical protein PHV34_00035 [Verrucomicrobiae bacterium]|nr:hypothetical protein [Verrucomicrobiae bacterium]